MFRYDRPQAGRYRQFWQFDVEAIGDPGPAVDAEIIELGRRFYREAGLADVEVHLNSIGDAACRPAYVAELRRVLPGARRPSCRPLERDAARDEPAAPARLEGPGDGRAQRGRAADHRPPVRRRAPTTSRRSGRTSTRSAIAYRLEPRPRPRPRLLHPDRVRVLPAAARGPAAGARRRRPLRRARRAARRPADAGHRVRARASTGSCSRSRPPGGAAGGSSRRRWRSSSAPIRRRPPSASGSPPTCARPGSPVRAELGPRKLGQQLESAARDGAHFAVILGDELADGQVQLRTSRPAPSSSWRSPTSPGSSPRAAKTHRHGVGEA